MPPREHFGRSILLELLGLKVEDVHCMQSNGLEKSFDVTFVNAIIADRILKTCDMKKGERLLCDYDIVSLDRPNFKMVTVQMYNPYVTHEQIYGFLSKYGEVLAAGKKIRDLLGFWTGKMQYQMLLKEDPRGYDGLVHPPAQFNIAGDKGFLFYNRQPPYCKRCKAVGHFEGSCRFEWCSYCRAHGHLSANCPWYCGVCKSRGHTDEDCPKRPKSYAQATRGGGGRGPGDGVQRGSEEVLGPDIEPVAGPLKYCWLKSFSSVLNMSELFLMC